jgi:beta-N-acetylhexosaminidase
MESAGRATTVKHFPGLGVVLGNTDFDTNVTDSVTTRGDARLAGFRAGVTTGVDMVMISSAVYTRIDPYRPATFSSTVLQGMVRGDLGFNGVIISDDLLGAALSSVAVRDRALDFVRAGGDLAIVSKVPESAEMVQALRQAATNDTQLRSEITAAATRVLAMKARHGLVTCNA